MRCRALNTRVIFATPVVRLGLGHHQPPGPGYRYLLIRRNRHTGELAFYRCYAPDPVPLPTLVSVAGLRWTIEVGHCWYRSRLVLF